MDRVISTMIPVSVTIALAMAIGTYQNDCYQML